MAEKQRWLPLESNPDVLNKYACDIGMPPSWQFVDVYSLDDDMLGVVPQPVIAVILLFPCSQNTKEQELGKLSGSNAAYFMKQTIGNACGTIAMIHALANNTRDIPFSDYNDKAFGRFMKATKDMSPMERAVHLENDLDMGAAHGEYAQEGQTETPSIDERVRNHFVALVHVDGELVELNGRRDGPIVQAKTTKDSFLPDAVGVVRTFMQRDPTEVNFSVMALVPA